MDTKLSDQQTAAGDERAASATATVDPAPIFYTPEEYLARERLAERKSEYRAGRIVAMTGASRAHNRITVNLGGELHQQLRRGPCEVYIADMRVRVRRSGLYTYPDVVVACGDIQFEDDQLDTLLNPVVVIEVLSPSTESYDRNEKFSHYRRLDSLQEYVLVAQDGVRVQRYARQGDQWVIAEYTSLDDELPLDAIGCRVRLRDVYERVRLPGEPAEPAPGGALNSPG
ncbi:MAG: Uma2 family endonuclease [Chloroflexota bacterium]